MAVAIQIICDRCGRRTKEIVFDGAAPRGEIEALRRSDGWERFRSTNTAANEDVCAACTEDWRAGRRAGKAVK